jgi:hypothetical protein
MIFENSSGIENPPLKKFSSEILGKFISGWWKIWGGKTRVFRLKAFTGHGSWDGLSYKHSGVGSDNISEKIAVLTRATIRFTKLLRFWKYVPSAAVQLRKQPGLQFTVGIGEIPFIKQATFSVWDSVESVKNYAYHQAVHKEIVRLTKKEKWYSEEMFVRFQIIEEFILKY